jgi:hypothetical protein
MQYYYIRSLLIAFLFSICFVGGALANSAENAETSISISTIMTPRGCIIRISGKVVEQATRKPLRKASIIVKEGERVLAAKLTERDGSFTLHIPPEAVTGKTIDVKIVYMKHIFLQPDIKPISQNLNIEINGSLLLKDEYFDEHKVPVHTLNKPEVGKVVITRPKSDRSEKGETIGT